MGKISNLISINHCHLKIVHCCFLSFIYFLDFDECSVFSCWLDLLNTNNDYCLQNGVHHICHCPHLDPCPSESISQLRCSSL